MINKKTNKHGNIPITILVIGVVIICILTLTSFLVSKNKVNNGFSAINAVEVAGLIKEFDTTVTFPWP